MKTNGIYSDHDPPCPFEGRPYSRTLVAQVRCLYQIECNGTYQSDSHPVSSFHSPTFSDGAFSFSLTYRVTYLGDLLFMRSINEIDQRNHHSMMKREAHLCSGVFKLIQGALALRCSRHDIEPWSWTLHRCNVTQGKAVARIFRLNIVVSVGWQKNKVLQG